MKAIQAVGKISAYGALLFEDFLFKLAHQQLPGSYEGGAWTSKAVNGYWIAVPPVKDTVRLVVPTNYTDIETTRNTAAAVLTTAALNFTIWKLNEGGRHPNAVNALSKMYHGMVDALRSSDFVNSEHFNQAID